MVAQPIPFSEPESKVPISRRDLAERTIQRRAVEAFWGMPLVSTDAVRQAFRRDAGAKYGDIVYFSKPANWKFQLLTPNAPIYCVPFDLKDWPAAGSTMCGRKSEAALVKRLRTSAGPTGQCEIYSEEFLTPEGCQYSLAVKLTPWAPLLHSNSGHRKEIL